MRDTRRAVVVGAGRGLGASVVEELLSEGWHVTAVSRSSEPLERVRSRIGSASTLARLEVKTIDMSVPVGMLELSEHLGDDRVEGLVVTAGSGRPVGGGRNERLTEMVTRNVSPALNSIDALERNLVRSDSSSVVLTTSIAALEWIPCPPEYAAAKAALTALVGHLARELAPIRVNAVAAGNMMTDGSVWREMARTEPDRLKGFLENEVPSKSIAQPDQVASVVAFLLSSSSKFITGTSLVADGGQTRRFG